MVTLRRPFYGWVIVGAVAVLLAASSGARFSFGVFLKPIADAHGWDRAALSLAISINLVLGGVLQPFAGAVVDRFGARLVGALGMAVLGASFAALAFADQLWQFYLLYGVVGALGTATTSSVLSAKLVGAWFERRRGSAMSFSTSGTAIGQLLVVPFATWTLVNFGVSAGFEVIAALGVAIVAPLAWALLRDDPASVGLRPDGDAPRPAVERELRDEGGVDLATALRSPVFWLLSFGLVACGVTMSFPSTHLMPYAMDMHMPEMVAATSLGLAGGLSLPAAIATGWLADRVGRARMLTVIYALRGLTYVFLLMGTTEQVWLLAAFVLGLSWSGTVPLSAAIAADTFGRRNLGTITGAMVTGMWVASGVAAFAAGLVYDHTGSYQLALVGNGALGFLAAVVVYQVRAVRRAQLMPSSA